MDLKNSMNSVQLFVQKYDTELLIGTGLAFGTAAMVATSNARHRSDILVRKAKKRQNVTDIPTMDKLRLTWKEWIAPLLLKIGSDGCLIFAIRSHRQHITALTTACTLGEIGFRTYQEKVKEVLGPKAEKKVREAVAQDRINDSAVTNPASVTCGHGTTLVYDLVLDRYFWCEKERIDKAENYMNKRVRDELYTTLNCFYEQLDIPTCRFGERNGICATDNYGRPEDFSITYGTAIARDERTPVLTIDYSWIPEERRW